jgi:flagellar basal body-associated protein FliL
MRKGVWIIALLPIIILLWIIGWTLFWIGTEQQAEPRETVKIVVPITEEITA